MNFDNLNSYADWQAKLKLLLDAAHDALASKVENADDLVHDAQVDLRDFGSQCDYDQLARIAKQAVQDIAEDAITTATASIAGLTDELENLTNGISDVSKSNVATAGFMRFDAAKKAVDSTIDAVAALKSIRQQLNASQKDEKALGKDIDSLIADIQAVRNQIEVLNHPSN